MIIFTVYYLMVDGGKFLESYTSSKNAFIFYLLLLLHKTKLANCKLYHRRFTESLKVASQHSCLDMDI